MLTIQELTHIIEMTLIVGLYLLTIGTFLGGVWPTNHGTILGLDPKRPGTCYHPHICLYSAHAYGTRTKGEFALNLASLLGISSVIMTYFGVNYYLSGYILTPREIRCRFLLLYIIRCGGFSGSHAGLFEPPKAEPCCRMKIILPDNNGLIGEKFGFLPAVTANAGFI